MVRGRSGRENEGGKADGRWAGRGAARGWGAASVGSGHQAAGRGLRAGGSGSGGLEPEPEPPGHAGSAPLPPATLGARLAPPSPGPMLAGEPGGGHGAVGEGPRGTAACPQGPEPQMRDTALGRAWGSGVCRPGHQEQQPGRVCVCLSTVA